MNYKLFLLALFLSPSASVLSMNFDDEIFEEMVEGVRSCCFYISENMPGTEAFLNNAVGVYWSLNRDFQKYTQENLWKRSEYLDVSAVCLAVLQEITNDEQYKIAFYDACNATRNRCANSNAVWDRFIETASGLIAKKISQDCFINFAGNNLQFFRANKKFIEPKCDAIHLKSALFLLYNLKQIQKNSIKDITDQA